jgi:hypothetical protein
VPRLGGEVDDPGHARLHAKRHLAGVIAAPADRDAMQASSAEMPVIDMHSL